MARYRPPDYLPAEVLNRPDFIAACKRREMGRILAIAEKYGGPGFTVSHIARRCEMTVSQVQDYIKRRRQAIKLELFERASDGLHIPGRMLGMNQRPWEAPPAEAHGQSTPAVSTATTSPRKPDIGPSITAPANSGSPNLYQIELLRQEMNDALNHGAMAEATLDDWERAAIRYARATRDRPPIMLLGNIGRDLAELKLILSEHRSASALRRLTRVTAQLSGLMCLGFCKLDDPPAFQRWARTARLAANEAGDPETLSWILAQEAYGHYYGGDMLEAIDVARHAQEVIRTACTGVALAAALEARAHACLGRHQETREALARAENILSQLNGDALIPSAFGYNESSYRFHEGNAYTHLRDVQSALKAQERALELCGRDDYTDWAMTRLDRAQCLMYSGELTAGLEYATETVTSLTGQERKGIITLRGREIVGALPEREEKLGAARDFRELLMLPAGNSEAEPR